MKTILLTIFAFCAILIAAPVHAQSGIDQLKTNLGAIGTGTGLGEQEDADLTGRIAGIINIVLGFLAIIAVIVIIYAGFKWMTAGGNEEQVKEARGNIKNAVIGIAVVLLAFVIVNFAVTQLSETAGSGGGGTTISGPASCVYSFSGCNQLCIDISSGSCSNTYPWPACGAAGGAGTGNLTSEVSGLCSATCPGCSSP